MKKLLLFLFVLITIICIISIPKKTNNPKELRAVFISYIEISKYLYDKEENQSKQNIDKMINNIKQFNCNTIILQVRPSSDAIYYSKIFPISKYLSSTQNFPYDVLKYFIEKSHNQKIQIYAWINPYRISTTSNIGDIKEDNPAYKYINTDTIYIKNGIYFNPSKKDVTNLIVEGVKEVLEYDIDGLLFDDYFYPSNDIDINDYNKTDKNISIEEYHLNVINNMVKQVHKECIKKNIPFGISPDGNNDNNYHKNYADVKRWLSSTEYVDFIAPQIYYGFYNSNKPFTNTVNEWSNLIKNKNIRFYPALAFYKVGLDDYYAMKGHNEWIENDNIIMREIIYIRNTKGYNGFFLYRYDNIFDDKEYQKTSKNEINNVKKILN